MILRVIIFARVIMVIRVIWITTVIRFIRVISRVVLGLLIR